MEQDLTRRIYQDENFNVNGFSGKQLEQLIGFEREDKPGQPVIVYIKAEGKDWQHFFLDAGIGFWEHTGTIDPEHEPGFIYTDYTQQYDIRHQKIKNIYCKKIQVNSQIVIALEHGEQIVLRCQNPDLFDSDTELVKIRENTSQ